jgi:hypothetical protein
VYVGWTVHITCVATLTFALAKINYEKRKRDIVFSYMLNTGFIIRKSVK